MYHDENRFQMNKNALATKSYFPVMLKAFYWKISGIIITNKMDKSLGIETKNDYSISLGRGDNEGYSATLYPMINRVLDYLDLKEDDVFADLGCGKGRVAFMASTRNPKKVIGIELNDRLYDHAVRNLRKLKIVNSKIDICHGSVLSYDLDEITVFYMHNPFGDDTLRKLLNNIKSSLGTNPRKIRIVYGNPVYRYLLDECVWLKNVGLIENTEMQVWESI